MRWMRTLLASALLALGAGGCSLLDRQAETANEPSADAAGRIIAEDFMAAITRLEGDASQGATMSFARGTLAEDDVLAALEPLMRRQGYAVRVVSDETLPGTITHRAEPAGDAAASTSVHTLSVGDVQLRRSYVRVSPERVEPAGSLFVRGTTERIDAPTLTPAPTRTPARTQTQAQTQAQIPAQTPAPAAPSVPGDVLATGVGTGAADMRAARAPTSSPPASSADSPPLGFDPASGKPVYSGVVAGSLAMPMTRNVMDLDDDSNYAGLFAGHADIDEVILVFADDSMKLGAENKAIIRETLERFDPERDMFSIVGCSLGPTKIPNGNQALALGRANRVKEELLFAGVSSERIVDEGCWAGEAAMKFPSRGVVLTLKRVMS